jgi:hypothetical protein
VRDCVIVDTAVVHAVGPRRLFSYLQFLTARDFDVTKNELPKWLKEPPRNTSYRRLDLNATTVRDFGRHGKDLDRMIADVVEDFLGGHSEHGKRVHGLVDIDRQILDVQVRYGARGAELWVLRSRKLHGVHSGLPRRLNSRERRASLRGQPATSHRQARRQQAAHAAQPQLLGASAGRGSERGVPLVVRLARERDRSDGDDDGG